MELTCPACFRTLQIAEEHAGQVVKCPHCAATFQAPWSPGMQPQLLPPAEFGTPATAPVSDAPGAAAPAATAPGTSPVVASAPGLPPPAAAGPLAFIPDTLQLAPEQTSSGAAHPAAASVKAGPYGLGPAPSPLPPTPVAPVAPAAVPPPKPAPKGDYKRSFALYLRRDVVFLVAPLGLIFLFFLSFFPWHRDARHTLVLWQLAFGSNAIGPFQWIVPLLLGAAAATALGLMLERNVIPAAPAVRAWLPTLALLAAVLAGAGWCLFLFHYLWCHVFPAVNPATISMKLGLRVHLLVALGALLDSWLQRRARQNLPEPRIKARW